MANKESEYQKTLHLEFLKALHDEKIKAQSERATYITSKFAFITGLFGVGALQLGDINFSLLFYFIPFVAIGYDLYIRATDLSIKKMGAFLRNDPLANSAESEKAWEKFAARYRDKLAHNATTLFSYIIILAAAIAVFSQQEGPKSLGFYLWYFAWLLGSCLFNFLLWRSHRNQVKRLDEYQPIQ
jgi:hypothetical protein